MTQYDFEPLETSADTVEVSVNSAQSDDVSEFCSGENINVEGHLAIDNGNMRLCSSSFEADISTFVPLFASLSCQTSMLFAYFIHHCLRSPTPRPVNSNRHTQSPVSGFFCGIPSDHIVTSTVVYISGFRNTTASFLPHGVKVHWYQRLGPPLTTVVDVRKGIQMYESD